MFDVGCNIKSHRVGSVVVQKRGFESLYDYGGPVVEGIQTMNFNHYAYEVIDDRKSVNCLVGVNCVYQPGYLLTTTLNSKQHPGANRIRSLIEDMMDRLISEYSHKPHLIKEYSDVMSQAAM
eukprot:11941307-Ditylum_brightwellii.AAC.1